VTGRSDGGQKQCNKKELIGDLFAKFGKERRFRRGVSGRIVRIL
jgi:hypothetical protein